MKGRGASPERRAGQAKPGVEPLSQKAWERVEARLFERVERGELRRPAALASRALPRAPWWIGAAALLAAASVLLWRAEGTSELAARAAGAALQRSATPQAPETSPAPPAVLPVPARDELLATAEAAPAATHIVTTSAATETTIGEAEITLAAHSDASFSGSDTGGWLVRLERGQVDCHVAPRHGRPAFVVLAGDTRVSVVGTRFSVRRDGAAVLVRVREGHVRVASGSFERMLGPGEQWPAPRSRRANESARAASSDPARTRFERAARHEARDPELSLGLYAQLAQSQGPWSSNALYAQARLEFERGALAQAKPLLLRYLERHPRGVNASDVRALLLEIDARRE